MLNVQEGQTYVCKRDDDPWWTVNKEYKVVFDKSHELVIIDDDGDKWYLTQQLLNNVFKLKELTLDLNELTTAFNRFELKEENKMFKFKEGQTYICTELRTSNWIEGNKYKTTYDEISDEYVLYDEYGFMYFDWELNSDRHLFPLKEVNEMSDLIDNQAHYKNQAIEPIDLMRKNFSKEELNGFLQGNVLKYMLRYKYKNGIEDLKKAKTYLTWLINEEEK